MPPELRRPHCPVCLRPSSGCICQWITPVEHRVEVLILQHPLEAAHAKGTARLLHLSLPHSRLVQGEVFDEQVLRQLLTAPWAPGAAGPGAAPEAPCHTVLLYPESPIGGHPPMPAPPPLPDGWQSSPAGLRLVVLDGTWRKSRKMLYLNPLLQQLPRLPLQGMPVSRYRIRAAHGPDQLSTLEATCAALGQLEGQPERFAPLLAALDGFVGQQQRYLPAMAPAGVAGAETPPSSPRAAPMPP